MDKKNSPEATTVIRGGDSQESTPHSEEVSFHDWDRYRILECLGEGGMGTVYKAFDPALNRHVAIKFLHSADPASLKRFLRESRAQAQIEHAHVCKIYEVGTFEGRHYIAMQFIAGERLDQLRTRLTVEQKAAIGVQLAEALQAAHKLGIIHRDIKPANVLVEQTDQGWCSYIVDFGLARDTSVPGATKTGVVMGTPEYMSPEQAWGNPDEVDRRSDIYSLGATFYDLLTQHPPFQGNNYEVLLKLSQQDPPPPRKIVGHLPRDLETIVMKCLEKDPDRRYDSARALADDLQRYLNGEPILARPAGTIHRLIKKAKKHRNVAAIVALSAFVTLILGGIGLYSWWVSGKELELTRQIAETVEGMEWQMRVEHTTPLHDIRNAKSKIRIRMQEIEKNFLHTGKIGHGPANYALGRGFIALEDFDQARTHLQEAWKSGYTRPEVAYALGFTIGMVYQKELNSLTRMEEGPRKEQKLAEIRKRYREPALRYLKLGQGAASSAPEYAQALISFYEENYEQALKQCDAALIRAPWFYEAKILEGNIYFAMAAKSIHHNTDQGIDLYQKAQEAFRQASIIGASDPEGYVHLCEVGRKIMISIFYNKGGDMTSQWQQMLASCNQALEVDPENPIAHASFSGAHAEWAFYQGYVGQDPRPALQKAVASAKKAVDLDPHDPSLQAALGDAYLYFMGDAWPRGIPLQDAAKLAIQSYQKAVRLDPLEGNYNNLGYSYWYKALDQIDRGLNPMRALSESIESYRTELRNYPLAITTYGNLINALATKAEYELDHGIDPRNTINEALNVYQSCIKINSQPAFAIRNMAGALVIRGRFAMMHDQDPGSDFREAIKLAERAHQNNPAIASMFYSGVAYRYQAKYERQRGMDSASSLRNAIEKLENLAAKKIEYAPFYSELAEAWMEQARIDLTKNRNAKKNLAFRNAGKYLNQAISINPTYSHAFAAKGKLSLLMAGASNQEALKEAEQQLRSAIRLKPDHAVAHCTLAIVTMHDSEMLIDAEKLAQKCFDLNGFLQQEYADDVKQLRLLKKQS